MRYDGGSGADVPVVDHVVGLSVEYLGDPDPPRMRRPLSEQPGPVDDLWAETAGG